MATIYNISGNLVRCTPVAREIDTTHFTTYLRDAYCWIGPRYDCNGFLSYHISYDQVLGILADINDRYMHVDSAINHACFVVGLAQACIAVAGADHVYVVDASCAMT